jgi:hypothetical protein
MSQADRDLVAAIRAELASIDPTRTCDRLAESAGLGTGLVTREAAVARLAVRLGRGTDAGSLLATRPRPKHLRAREAGPLDGAPDLAFGPAGGPDPGGGFHWETAAEHCRLAWLRGRFLARGSLSLGNGRTHLEFVVPAAEGPVLAARLAAIGLPASWRLRRRRGVVTWKSAEAVGLFLRRIGGGAALLELEARQVSRALRGDLNRVINAESANLQRAVEAAGRQLAAIQQLTADDRLGELPYGVRAVAEARRETPEATLGELAERLGLHRSAVQRALERLERTAAAEPPEPGARRRPQHPSPGPGAGGRRAAARPRARTALA